MGIEIAAASPRPLPLILISSSSSSSSSSANPNRPHCSLLQRSTRNNAQVCSVVAGHLNSPSRFLIFKVTRRSTAYSIINHADDGLSRKSFFQTLRMPKRIYSHYVAPLIRFCTSLGYETKNHKISCWQETFKHNISIRLVRLVFGMMFVMAVSVSVNKAPSWALTDENLLFLEAWRTVDRAYYDKTFNGQSWFRYRETALRNEPMNTREETYAAIKKMLSTLDDPFTRFLEPEKFKSLRAVWHPRCSYRGRFVNRLSYST